MDHGSSTDWGKDNAVAYKTRIGLILFFVYCLIYAGFVIINTVRPSLMEINVFWGLNLACVYGFGLIIIAIIMGTIYNWMCTRAENRLNHQEGDQS